MRFPVRTRKVLPLLSLFFPLPSAGALAAGPPLTDSDPAVQQALSHARKLLAKGRLRPAVAELKRAAGLTQYRCVLCLLELGHAEFLTGSRDQAITTTRAALALQGTPALAAVAYNQLGALLFTPSADETRLAEAEGSLRRAVELGDRIASFNLASLRLHRGDPAEALDLARQFLDREPEGQAAGKARIVVCTARSLLPPGLAGTTPDGGVPLASFHGSLLQAFRMTGPTLLHAAADDTAFSPYGSVRVQVVVDEEGCVVHAAPSAVIKDPRLQKQAVQLAKDSVFQPATLRGRPVRAENEVWVGREVARASDADFPPVFQPRMPDPTMSSGPAGRAQ